jgi:nucleotide-binding universal stress UspA family protein
MESYHPNIQSALHDFQRARSRAAFQEIIARLTGKSTELLSYEEVRKSLKLGAGLASRGLQDIPLDAIVGSVDRYGDYTRTFLPRHDVDAWRWARVQMAMTNLAGLPPIEVYKVGDVYFVLDGNHRVSVARQLGNSYIQAYVTEVPTPVPLTPDTRPDELIIKARYAAFLKRTGLDRHQPEVDLTVTVPGQYRILEEHIQAHHHLMELDQGREVSLEEAAAHWYDEVYRPVVEMIREQGILRDFPERTETDLYLWLSEHHQELEQSLGWEIDPAAAATDLRDRFSKRPQRLATRMGGKLWEAMIPDELEAGPPPGQWRREQGWPDASAPPRDRLFAGILVPVSGLDTSWYALEQAQEIARREGGRLLGLHVVSSADRLNSPEALAVQAEFNRRCEAAGVPGNLVIDAGQVANKICERTRWVDVTVVNLAHPPSPQPFARLTSGFRTLIRRCNSPVLAVPRPASPMDRALLAYDGSPKADEALFLVTYLAHRWQFSLAVVSVSDNRVTPATLAQAQAYLAAHEIEANFVEEHGDVPTAILKIAAEHESNLIVMGGYGFTPVLEVLLGSAVDRVLQSSWQPVLICR